MSIQSLLTTAIMVPLSKTPLDDPNTVYGLPVCFTGEPGTAKSEMIEMIAQDMQFLTHTVFIPSVTAEDLGGYPVMLNGKFQRMTDDPVIQELAEIGEGVVFLDEINTNSQNIYRALLSVLLKRRYGGVQLSGRVRFLAAMNPVGSSAGGIDFPAPVANRFCHIAWQAPSVSEWCDWVTDSFDDKEPLQTASQLEKKLVQNWDASWSDTASKVIGFVSSNQSLLHSLPEPGTPAFSSAWPSRRIWWWASRAMATAKALKVGEAVRITLLRGCVGDGATKAYLEWEKAADLPTADEMLTDGFVPDKMRLDRTRTSLNTLAMHVSSLKKTDKSRIEAATKTWEVLLKSCENGVGDLITRPSRLLINAGLGLTLPNNNKESAAMLQVAEKVLGRLGGRNIKASAVDALLGDT